MTTIGSSDDLYGRGKNKKGSGMEGDIFYTDAHLDLGVHRISKGGFLFYAASACLYVVCALCF